MVRWPSIVRRQVDARESTVLWDSTVFFFGLGLPVLVFLALTDPTEINGEARWIKPLKFFISIAVYNLNLEWLFRLFRTDRNVRWFNGIRWVIAVGMLIEAVSITVQAARGVQSHFNVATPLDTFIFNLMGVSITLVVLAALFGGWLIWKARDQAPPRFGEAIFLGILIMTLGSFQGFTMTHPSVEQQAAAERGERPPIVGSHFVGTPPAGAHDTLPFMGWSLDIGDLRIPHFIGIHALQCFLLLAFLLHHFRAPAPGLVLRSSALLYGGLFLLSYYRAQAGMQLI